VSDVSRDIRYVNSHTRCFSVYPNMQPSITSSFYKITVTGNITLRINARIVKSSYLSLKI